MPKDPWGNPYQYLNPGTHGEIDIHTAGSGNASDSSAVGNWSLGE
ncbi:MAG: type II secretion system protein GspG [Nevskia sp.]|nr:type II secretion system protein GspG [Nevskia sp.]